MDVDADQPHNLLARRINAAAQAHELWVAGDAVLLAVSGGADSVAMLHLLATAVGPAARLRLAVAHVNHSLRADAGEDAAFVTDLAARFHLPCLTQTVDVPARVAETGASVEEAARELRYDALQDMACETGSIAIATAHTADDQAETVLMRLLRGAGVRGLAGIPSRRDNIIRPLLGVWRAEIETYLAAHDVLFRLDTTNLSTEFFRNRIRHELLPLLEREYAPRLRERLTRLAEGARLDAAYLDGIASVAYARHAELLPDGVALPLLAGEAPALRRRLWRQALAAMRGGLDDIGYEHLAAIEALRPREEAHLPRARVIHETGRLVFLSADEPEETISDVSLPVPGIVELPGSRVTAACLPFAPALERDDNAVLDAAAVEGPLHVRGWQPGDRYRPFGAPGSRKLQDIFVDAGVPKRLRPRVPVVLDAQGIIWLAGFRIADRVKMVSTTTSTLRLHIDWEYSPWTFRNLLPG